MNLVELDAHCIYMQDAKLDEPAIKELREKSGLEIELGTERKGRAIDRLTFKFRDQEQMRLDFSATPELELALAETD